MTKAENRAAAKAHHKGRMRKIDEEAEVEHVTSLSSIVFAATSSSARKPAASATAKSI
ncbi:hypothetical protein AB7M63_004697 [Bradyrhizobium japonicum]